MHSGLSENPLNKARVKVVSVTPAGRRRYIEILARYLLRNRRHIDEHHFWINTDDPEDIRYLEELAGQYPEFFKLNRKPMFGRIFDSIWQYFRDYTEDGTVYIRLDDDIGFIAEDAIANLVQYRLDHPEPFLVYGNIVNNAICSYIQQQRGVLSMRPGVVGYQCLDPVGWNSGRFARYVHDRFLNDLRRQRLDRWRFDSWTMADYRRFSVNVICWFGQDMRQVEELHVRNLDEEKVINTVTGETVVAEEDLLSEAVPARYQRPNQICGSAVFAHVAFCTQRPFIEKGTALLEKYDCLSRRPGLRYWPAEIMWLEVMRRARHWVSWTGVRLNRRIAAVKAVASDKYPQLYQRLRNIKRRLRSEAIGS